MGETLGKEIRKIWVEGEGGGREISMAGENLK